MTHIVLVIIFSIFILIGTASFLLMIFPAHIYLLIVTLIFGIIDHFQHLLIWEWLILVGLVVVMIIIDWFSGLVGAKISGASKKSIWFGIAGLVLGLIFFPPFGSLIGLFLGVFVGEIIYFKESKKALKAATGSLLGSLAGTILNIILGLIYLVLFIIFAIH